MIGYYDISTGAVIELSAAQILAEKAREEVMRVGRLIDEDGDICTCDPLGVNSERGCEALHDEHEADLIAAIERCVTLSLEADPSRSRGEILSDILKSLERLSRHPPWEEIIPQEMEREIHQYALRRMEIHGLPQLTEKAA